FFFQAEHGIRHFHVTGVQTCALPISPPSSGLSPNATPLPENVNKALPASTSASPIQLWRRSTVWNTITSASATHSGLVPLNTLRSEERRVGNEGTRRCSAWVRRKDRY